MDPSLVAAAEAFSRHRFSETLPHLADDVRWVSVGSGELVGRDAVAEACEESRAYLATVTTELLRFLLVVGADAVVVDTVSTYSEQDGSTSTVSSCDIYEMSDGRVAAITSYAVEIQPDDGDEE